MQYLKFHQYCHETQEGLQGAGPYVRRPSWSTSAHGRICLLSFFVVMASFLPGYAAGIADEGCRSRYTNKLTAIQNLDPYEISKEEYEDNVDIWPATTYIHVGMYLVFTSSPYTGEDLLNYKSMECYQRFTSGWVREIRVKAIEDKRVVIAKVIVS